MARFVQVLPDLKSDLTLAAAAHLQAAGHLDQAADLIGRHTEAATGRGTLGVRSRELLMARASLRIAQVSDYRLTEPSSRVQVPWPSLNLSSKRAIRFASFRCACRPERCSDSEQVMRTLT